MLTGAHRQADPARSKDTQNVSMRKQRNVAGGPARSRYNSIDAGADLLRHLPPWASIPKKQPIGPPFTDLSWGQSLVIAVVPFAQIGLGHGMRAKPGQFASLSRPSQRADENELECLSCKNRQEPLREPASIVGQRDISRARMLAAQAPRRLTMPDRENIHLTPETRGQDFSPFPLAARKAFKAKLWLRMRRCHRAGPWLHQ
jgi:hypothetical protein